MSTTTITRDVQALAQRPPLPLICPTCGLPSRLDVDPATVTDDPEALAALEAAMARLIGAPEDPEASPRRRPVAHNTRPARPQRNDRPEPKVRTLGATATHA